MSVKMSESSHFNLTSKFEQAGGLPKPEKVDLPIIDTQTDGIKAENTANTKLTEVANKILAKVVNEKDAAKEDEKDEEIAAFEEEKIAEAMKTISDFISMPIRTVNFTQDDGSEKTVIKVFDSESKELIKQFPSEEILMIAQRIVELQQDVSKKTGILLDESI